MAISTSVPIFIIFLFSLHRVATEPHLPRKKNLTGIRSNIAASSDYRGQARVEQEGRRRAERAKRQKQSVQRKNI